jgi:hypothetical protein
MALTDTGYLCRLVAEAAAGRSKRKDLLRQRAEKAKKEAIDKAKSGNHKPTSGPSSPPKTTTAPATTVPAT